MLSKELKKEKIAWLRRHNLYEKQNYRLFSAAIKKMAKNVPYNAMSRLTYEDGIAAYFETSNEMYEAVLDIHLNAGRREFNYQRLKIDAYKRDIEQKRSPLYNAELVGAIAENLIQTGGLRIVSMKRTLANFLIRLLGVLLTNEDLSFTRVVTSLLDTFEDEDFYRYQIERIVRTETTQASQFTALQAMDDPDIYIDKVWMSIDDDRTRDGDSVSEMFNHRIMDGNTVKLEEYFIIPTFEGGTEALLYPAAPTTGSQQQSSAGNVINCRCGLGRVPRLDKNGRPILKR